MLSLLSFGHDFHYTVPIRFQNVFLPHSNIVPSFSAQQGQCLPSIIGTLFLLLHTWNMNMPFLYFYSDLKMNPARSDCENKAIVSIVLRKMRFW